MPVGDRFVPRSRAPAVPRSSVLAPGYRHVDTAQAYGNERSVGRALRDSGLPREEAFITTKFNPGRRDPEAEVQRSLERLGVDAVDLYIIHWPQGGPTWAWEGMQRAHGRGYARSIGVSNFGASDLRAVLEVADVPPVINQVQFSPFAFRRALLEACDRRGVALEAYSPLGTGRHLGDRRVAAMAERLGRTPAQVPDPLVAPARPGRAAEVHAPRAYRAKRAGLRLSALG